MKYATADGSGPGEPISRAHQQVISLRLELQRQITIATNKQHSQWVTGWLYENKPFSKCACAYCK